jgi:hypothetical protein
MAVQKNLLWDIVSNENRQLILLFLTSVTVHEQSTIDVGSPSECFDADCAASDPRRSH